MSSLRKAWALDAESAAKRVLAKARALTLLVFFLACSGEDSTEDIGALGQTLCTKTTLSVSTTGPVPAGTTIQLTATSPSCAVGETPEYRFLMRRDGATSAYTELRAYAAGASYGFNTTGLPSGKYTLLVYSRALGSSVTKDSSATTNVFVGSACPAVTLTATPGVPQVPGASIALDAAATCSSGTAEYKFFVKPPVGAYAAVSDWGSSHFQWNTSGLGNGPYSLRVYSRAVGNTSALEGSVVLGYPLGNLCSAVTGSFSPAGAASPGSSVTITGAATCSNQAAADYQFSARLKGTSTYQLLRAWGPSTFVWPTTGLGVGTYQVLVETRASDYAGAVQAKSVLNYTLGGLCSAATLTVTPNGPQPLGTSLGLTGAATCAGAPGEYRFSQHGPTTTAYTEIAPWSSVSSVVLPTSALIPGKQYFRVEVRAQGSGTSVQTNKAVTYLLGDICNSVALSVAPPSPQPAGSSVTLTASASCLFGGEPEYRFLYTPAGGAQTLFRDWQNTPSVNLSPLGLPTGSYTLRVEARGQEHPGPSESARQMSYVFSAACPSGYQGNGGGGCVDIDECATNNGGCDPLSACSNSPGSFACGACPSGYTGSGATGCTDINECATNNGGCHALTTCSNTQGSFSCSTCPSGYAGTGATGCTDINECATNNGGCHALTTCANLPGSFACGACPSGYTGTGATGCVDINECATNNGGCHALTVCTNLPGTRSCGACPSGYSGTGATGCTDINECATNNGGCDALTLCTNLAGGYLCGACPSGYTGTGATGCTDVNECATNNGGCDALTLCTNTAGSFSCGPCPAGYTGTGATGCIPASLCSPNPCQNGGTCTQNGGAFTCTCSSGYGGQLCQIAPATLLVAGDVADCSLTGDTATGLLLDTQPGTIALLGDAAYPDGTTADFANCFEPVWGRHKARIFPVPGNHEYVTTNAAPYYAYFGANAGDPTKGYYSYNLGTWHVVALNSNCSNVSCSAGSAQETWLRGDLAANPAACTLAYWHHPRFSSGEHGNSTSMSALFAALVDGGVEIGLAGHDHDYERFVPQNNSAVASASGVAQFVVGTGGVTMRSFGTIRANSAVRQNSAHGVLKLTLAAGSYTWQFLPVAGQTFSDSGMATCH